jgi:methylenetetrahydrofolate dehydrogenase (NADP+)/methenyltetrahydrofolate cyclohydrolase
MEEKLIKGTEIAKNIRHELKLEIEKLKNQNLTPGLAVVLVGDNPASKIYVNMKGKACQEVGIFSETIRIDADISQEKLLKLIIKLNQDQRYNGILVQLPLPDHIKEQSILESVNPAKDVDCFHPENVGRLVIGNPYVVPCTPAGIMELLHASSISTVGKHAVILGRSNIVGKPMANLLMQKSAVANATVTIVHSRTNNIAAYTREADIIIAAMGQAHFIDATMIKENVVIIDVGMNRIPAENEKGYKLVGDVNFEAVLPKVSKITPVPGGVGPMTIAMLLKNTITAAKYQSKQ